MSSAAIDVIGTGGVAVVQILTDANALTDGATYVSQTVPDDTVEGAGQGFTNTWTVKNSGTTTWNSNYSLRSEERRVGKECTPRCRTNDEKNNKNTSSIVYAT